MSFIPHRVWLAHKWSSKFFFLHDGNNQAITYPRCFRYLIVLFSLFEGKQASKWEVCSDKKFEKDSLGSWKPYITLNQST